MLCACATSRASTPICEARGSPLELLLSEHRGHRRAARRASGSALAFERKRKQLREEPSVRDIETIDAELGLIVRAWRVARVVSDRIPSTAHIDELLDERAAALEREGFFSSLSSLSRAAASSPGSRR
jgi:hypothetical protein